MSRALKEFSQKSLKSIALPAVGAGNLGYPHKEVADTLVATTVEFLNKNPGSTLNKVSFVSYSDDVMLQVSFSFSNSSSRAKHFKQKLPSCEVTFAGLK